MRKVIYLLFHLPHASKGTKTRWPLGWKKKVNPARGVVTELEEVPLVTSQNRTKSRTACI